MIILYHQTKILINFLYKRGLNFRSLIQPIKFLPIKLTGIHTVVKFVVVVSLLKIYKV